MDGKKALVIMLGILVAGMIVAFVLFFSDLRKTQGIFKVKDIVTQEKQYQNENFASLVENNADSAMHNKPQQGSGLQQHRAFRKALLSYEAGMYREALGGFTDIQADTLDPEQSAAVYYHMASCLINLDEGKKAIRFLNRVIQEMKPNEWTTKCVILLGEINRKHQFSDESLEVYLHKLYIETSDPAQKDEILTQLGYLKFFRGNLDGAMEHFQRARSDLARLGEARVYIEKDMYWKAISIYEDMLTHRNFANDAYYEDVKFAFQKQTHYYAKRWMDSGDYDHAYFYFRKIINFFPNTTYGESSLFWIGEIFYARRDWDSAIRYYNLVLSNGTSEKDADAQFKKGMVYHSLKRYAEAIRNFRIVLDYHKSSAYSDRAKQWIEMCERELMYNE
ncbi:MAG: tetratricopeptide repeat protein [Spirochaetota bacterium]|jgi:tetratricopeptide (TPR) repeat protein|nr:tetratricopeptide repeat protein [Spirochaetota bacterium]